MILKIPLITPFAISKKTLRRKDQAGSREMVSN
jgi:hypothetical protein